MINILKSNEYNPYYSGYIGLVTNNDLLAGLKESHDDVLAFYESIPDDKWGYRYVTGKWTVKEVVQHILDTERVFAYRALCFAREDGVRLPGFDQDDYLGASGANSKTKDELINEYKALRGATMSLFSSFDNEMLLRIGIANESPMSVRAAGFVITGHEKHHCNVIRERYL